MPELAFDQVALKVGGGLRLLTPDEWLAIPTLEQFDLIIAKAVEFRLAGEVVKTTDAVRSTAAYRSALARES